MKLNGKNILLAGLKGDNGNQIRFGTENPNTFDGWNVNDVFINTQTNSLYAFNGSELELKCTFTGGGSGGLANLENVTGKRGNLYYRVNSETLNNNFVIEVNESEAFDGAGARFVMNNLGVAFMASESMDEISNAPALELNNDGSIYFSNINEFKCNDKNMLDESMALSADELDLLLN